eukprot:GFUD01031017.1.p1 GENE.GFUD01031017.1~~GFUD01031017.1.p1  ORF type:complete len:385 (+),score=130.30 GFUD01031017.1:323-1477(+)
MFSKLLCGPNFPLKPAQLTRQVHCSAPRPALPPLLFTLAKPLARIVAAVVGRGARVWWKKLPQDKRLLFKEAAKRHRKKFVVAGTSLLGGLAYAYESHIQECGVTGRRRFVALTPDQTKKISRVEFQNLLEDLKPDILPDRHPIYERVVKVSNRILQGNRDIRQIYDKNWTVTVVDQPVKNAFVLPSGNIFVFKGMLDLCENDDQLGIILGHEMAHTVLGHVAEKLTMASFVQVVLLVPMAVLWAILPNDGVALVANWFIDQMIQLIVDLPFSRDMEMEADEVGLVMAAKACFDVREAPALWGLMELMSEDPMETDRDLEFVSTHPCHGTRQESLSSQLASALTIRFDCGCARLDQRRDPQIRLEEFKRFVKKQQSMVLVEQEK